MKVLILDHHFSQDIDSLLIANSNDHEVRTIAPDYFAREAAKLFPPRVFDSDLSAYHDPNLSREREVYRGVATSLLCDLYRIFPFDVFVSPSDTFFYIRDVIDACHELSVPFVVVQKEAGVSPRSLEKHAAELRRWFPFKGDWMAACSMRSKQFWVAAGAAEERISVVGQPRFDFYHRPQSRVQLDELGVKVDCSKPIVLFLSYDLDAYNEERALGRTTRPWERMRRETEDVLFELGKSGMCNLLVKPHPQQDSSDLDEISRRAKGSPGVVVLDRAVDTRQLIVGSDVVVGFQTTALAEAMAAGKRVIYTFWSTEVINASESLLPFHELEDCISVARSPTELRAYVLHDEHVTADSLAKRRMFFESFFGCIDGLASARVWKVLEALVTHRQSVEEKSRSIREELQRETARYCLREARRARRRLIERSIILRILRLMPGASMGRIAERFESWRSEERDRLAECLERAVGRFQQTGRLVGHNSETLLGIALTYLRRRCC